MKNSGTDINGIILFNPVSESLTCNSKIFKNSEKLTLKKLILNSNLAALCADIYGLYLLTV